MFSLDTLEKALASVEQIGKGEKTYQVGDTTVTLRVLNQEEELEVQAYAREALQEEEGNREQLALDFINRFKVAVLSYALVQVGPTDFRQSAYVETGEVLDNGVKVKIPKTQALRKLLNKWSSNLLHGIFRRYSELAREVEIKADKAMKFEPADMDTEIERLEKRLVGLREEKETQQKDAQERAGISDMVRQFAQDEGALEAPTPPVEAPRPSPAPAPQPVRRTALPDRAAPPTPPAAPPATSAALPVRTAAPSEIDMRAGEDVPFEEETPYDLLPDFQDSLVSDDPESLAMEVARENARLATMRRQGLQHQVADATASVLTAAHQAGLGRRQPPHLQALQADQETFEPRRLERVGKIGDTPVYRGEVQDLSVAVPKQAPDQRATVINPPVNRSHNPRFRSPPRP